MADESLADLEISAFDILAGASDFESGSSSLAELYKKNPTTETASIISKYGNDLQHRFREKPFEFSDVPTIAPAKLDLSIPDRIEGINKWEEESLKRVEESQDPDTVVHRDYFKRSISSFASEARRDEHATGDGVLPWIQDKAVRVAEGVVGPFARLVGAEDTEKALYERTQRSRDDTVASQVATGLGAVAAFATGATVGTIVGGPAGGVAGAGAVFAGQAGGEARAMYERSMEETGDPERAALAAGLTVAAQALGIIPAGRLLGRVSEKVIARLGGEAAAKTLVASVEKGVASEAEQVTLRTALLTALDEQKKTLAGVLYETGAAGGLGYGSRVIGNIAQNIALDENGDITHGAANTFLANAILGGVFSGGHALLENATVRQAKRLVEEAHADPKVSAEATEPLKNSKGEVIGKPLFFKDDDGNILPTEDTPPTYDERVQQHREAETARDEYVNEQPSDAPVTNEKGEPVEVPFGEDYELQSRPEKTMLMSPDDLNVELSTGAYVTHIARKLAAKFELSRNIMDGALGAFFPDKGVVKILRSLGSDPEKFKKVLAHEIGHFVDSLEDPTFTRLFQMVKQTTDGNDTTYAEAKNVSMQWRKGWDGSPGDKDSASPRERFSAYRNNPQEIYADVFSAFVNNPGELRKNAPNLYRNLEENLGKVPELNKLFNDINTAETDPGYIARLDWSISKANRDKDADISAAARTDRIQKNSVPRRLRNSLDLAYRTVFDRYATARRLGRGLTGKAREAFFEQWSKLVAKDNISFQQLKDYDAPTNKLFTKALENGIDPHMWAQFEWDNRVVKESTKTIEAIKANPEQFMEAAQIIRSFLSRQKGVKHSMLEAEFNLSNIKSGDDLARAFARVGLIGDAAEVLSAADFINKYPNDPDAQIKGMRDYNLAVGRLNQRRESIPVEKLKEHIASLQKDPKLSQQTKDALELVMRPGAFSVRKFLVNPGGRTEMDSTASLTEMQKVLGPEKWKALNEISSEWHAALNSHLDAWEASGVFTPELMERIRLNKDNYVFANILKYFEGDENIDGSIRQAVGTLSDSGNEITSTLSKNKAVDRLVLNQVSRNAAVDIANDAGLLVEFRPRKKDEDIFAVRDRLNKEDPDHSYLIKYQKGVPFLAKISGGKGFAEMYDSVSTNPIVGAGLIISDQLSKLLLTRQLKTVFSPAFVAFQKFYDYRNEAILANSMEVTLGLPFHWPGKLSGLRKASREEVNTWLKTGELTGQLAKVIDLNGAALGKALMEEAGWHVEGSGEDNGYAVFGKKMPNEDSRMEAIGNWTEKQLDKVGGAWLKRIAEADELTTKLTGFRIGKELLGMGDAEAATFARERFGIPDPLGGGRAAPLINRMFLFGVAHFNGVRNIATMFKDMPKTLAVQATWRALLPKLLVSAPVMSALLTQFLGEESGDLYTTLYGMVPTPDKQGKSIFILGAQDGQGNYHNFTDIDPKEVQADWKAWYVRLPQSREVTAMTKVLWPIIENAGKGDVTAAVSGGLKAGLKQSAAGLQPAIQYLYNFGELLTGNNPTDFFRMKEIIPEQRFQAGSALDNLTDYGRYMASQQYPAVVPYNPFATGDPKGAGETTIQSIPLAGPMLRSFVGISNYGLIEQSKETQVAREKVNMSIALSTRDATQTLLSEYRGAAGQMSSLGAGWETKVGNDVAGKIQYLNTWHSRVWLPYRNELRAAMESGDDERYQYLLKELEISSKSVLPEVRGLSSSFEAKLKPDQK